MQTIYLYAYKWDTKILPHFFIYLSIYHLVSLSIYLSIYLSLYICEMSLSLLLRENKNILVFFSIKFIIFVVERMIYEVIYFTNTFSLFHIIIVIIRTIRIMIMIIAIVIIFKEKMNFLTITKATTTYTLETHR